MGFVRVKYGFGMVQIRWSFLRFLQEIEQKKRFFLDKTPINSWLREALEIYIYIYTLFLDWSDKHEPWNMILFYIWVRLAILWLSRVEPKPWWTQWVNHLFIGMKGTLQFAFDLYGANWSVCQSTGWMYVMAIYFLNVSNTYLNHSSTPKPRREKLVEVHPSTCGFVPLPRRSAGGVVWCADGSYRVTSIEACQWCPEWWVIFSDFWVGKPGSQSSHLSNDRGH